MSGQGKLWWWILVVGALVPGVQLSLWLYLGMAQLAAVPIPKLSALRARLASERARLSARFSSAALRDSLVRGAGIDLALGARLTEAALSGSPYVVGVTGGSSTAGHNSWPTLLHAWLHNAVGVTGAVIRNAGQGTTSQLVTAPCIHALVGDDVDLLLWEFAMNDEYNYIENDSGPEWPIRRRVAESYIRQAAQLGFGCIGFVHLWDLDIHGYGSGPSLPNKSFAPTNAVMAAYAPVYDRYFALDVIGAMWVSGLYMDKKDFLRDDHHPNAFGYGVILDLVALSILNSWEAYLDLGGTGAPEPLSPYEAATVRAHPMLTHQRDDLFLPDERTLAHCYMAMPPQFSSPGTGAVRAEHNESCTSPDAQNCKLYVDVGRSTIGRDDRQLRFTTSVCTPGGTSGGMLFVANLRRITAVLVYCGYQQGDYCLGALDLFLDGLPIAPNVPVSDILSAFYKWAHRVDATAYADAPSHTLRVCARDTSAKFSRLVVLEQL